MSTNVDVVVIVWCLGCLGGWMDGWVDGWVIGWVDGQMGGVGDEMAQPGRSDLSRRCYAQGLLVWAGA